MEGCENMNKKILKPIILQRQEAEITLSFDSIPINFEKTKTQLVETTCPP